MRHLSLSRSVILYSCLVVILSLSLPLNAAFAQTSTSPGSSSSSTGSSGGTNGGTGGGGNNAGGNANNGNNPFVNNPNNNPAQGGGGEDERCKVVDKKKSNPLQIQNCVPGIPDWMLTTRIVTCVKQSIIVATTTFLQLMSDLMWPVAMAILLFATILFGIRIFGGEQRELQKDSYIFIIKIGFVLFFTYNMGGFVWAPFAIMDQAIALVTGGWLPWVQIDLMLGRMFGFAPGIMLFQGLMGIIGAALFSSATGVFLFIFGLMVILALLNMVFRAVYTYLGVVLVLGFIIIISPIFVPLIMFQVTSRHHKKWFDLLIGVMLQPFILFGFLWIFLGLVDGMIGNVFIILGGDNFTEFWQNNQATFSWIMPTDPGIFQQYEQATGADRAAAPIANFVNPMMSRTVDANPMHFPGIDFGPDNILMFQRVILGLVATLIVLILMISMLDEIPYLSDSIAGIATGIRYERLPLVSDLKRAVSSIQQGGG